ncbi:MAG: hypothetical protein ACOYOL_09080 [Chthoniobacterales bacterium]
MMLAVGVALILPVALVVAGFTVMFRASRPAPPSPDPAQTEALRAAIERAANVVMPVPTLTDEVVALDCPAESFEKEVQRVVRLARGVGGSASSWNDGQTVRLVVNVPASVAEVFREAVRRGVYDIAAAGEEKTMKVIQVVLRPVEARPTPPPPAKKKKS